jgi:hypothetical protein
MQLSFDDQGMVRRLALTRELIEGMSGCRLP